MKTKMRERIDALERQNTSLSKQIDELRQRIRDLESENTMLRLVQPGIVPYSPPERNPWERPYDPIWIWTAPHTGCVPYWERLPYGVNSTAPDGR